MLMVSPTLAANTNSGGNRGFNQPQQTENTTLPNVNTDDSRNNNQNNNQGNTQNKPININNQQKFDWDTTITATVTGAYTFYVSSTNGASLYVGDMNSPLIVGKFSQSATEQSVTVKLTEGRTYAVKIEYFSPNESSTATVNWSAPNIEKKKLERNDFSSNVEKDNKNGMNNNQSNIVNDNSGYSSLGNLTVSDVSATNITITWSSISSATEYIVYRDGKIVGTTQNSYYTDTGLSSDASYTYIVKALVNSKVY